MPKVIGFYGGTFDPFHLGHLNLALEMQEKRKLDEIWLCPAKINPHKLSDEPVVSAYHRLKMLQLSTKHIPHFHVLDTEIKQEGPSYTFTTLKHLLKNEKSKKEPNQLALIVGDDTLKGLLKWHQIEEILNLVPLFVGSRTASFNPQEFSGSETINKALVVGWTPIRIMEISSTEIRQRLSQGKYCGHLMPKECLDYISKNQLYSFFSKQDNYT
jgi:nicotinate-nucleotide adenylyltransferase